MDANSTKGLCIALLFLDTLLFGWPPYFLIRGGRQSSNYLRRRSMVISYLTCFAGGVFLGACLLHLLAEGREQMEDYFKQIGKDIDFPVYETVAAGGFFLIATIEQLVHLLLHDSRHVHGQSHQNNAGQGGGEQNNANHTNYDSTTGSQPSRHFNSETRPGELIFSPVAPGSTSAGFDMPVIKDHKVPGQVTEGVDNPAYCINNASTKFTSNGGQLPAKRIASVSVTFNGMDVVAEDADNDNSVNISSEDKTTVAVPAHGVNGSVRADGQSPRVDIEIGEEEPQHDHNQEMVQIVEAMEVNPLRAFLLLAALSFHTVFDGLAVGLQTKQSSVWEMFTAICIHKSLVALCLGMQLFLVFKNKPVKAFVWVFIFSLISPIGVGIGMILTSGNADFLAERLASWILQGLATGTFLYVTVFEMLHDELTSKGGVLKILVIVLGFGGMAVAKYFDAD